MQETSRIMKFETSLYIGFPRTLQKFILFFTIHSTHLQNHPNFGENVI